MKKIAFVISATLLSACSTLMPTKTVSGTYQGTLPCADCQKIEAELILNKDNSYVYNTVYFKNKKQQAFTDKGVFTWDEAKNNVITLDANAGNLKFQINEQYVEVCDAKGNTAETKQNYRLNKVTP